MDRSERNSWRVVFDDHPYLLHFALYVRDSCSLVVAEDPGVPPRLNGEIPNHGNEISRHTRETAGKQWLFWWNDLVAQEGANQIQGPNHLAPGFERMEAFANRRLQLFDPPHFESLLAMPELREVVLRVSQEVALWELERRDGATRRSSNQEPRVFDHEIIRAVAESMLVDNDVVPEKLRAAVLVLDVDGHWAHLPAAGILVCSQEFTRDELRFRSSLTEALRTGMNFVETRNVSQHPSSHPLPPSLLNAPFELAQGKDTLLTLEGVHRYPDGFELRLSRNGVTPSTASMQRRPGQSGMKSDPFGFPDHFVGLQIGLRFVDGRSVMVEDLSMPDEPSALVLNRFWRSGCDENTLWLWAMPLPPAGPVTISVHWPQYDIDGESVIFDGRQMDTESGFD